LIPPFRPAPSQPSAADGAPHQAAQGEGWPIALARSDDPNPSAQHALNAIEHVVGDQRIEITTGAVNAVIRHIKDSDIQPVLEHQVKGLRADRQSTPRPQAQPGVRAE
jgi:hypothetical protein